MFELEIDIAIAHWIKTQPNYIELSIQELTHLAEASYYQCNKNFFQSIHLFLTYIFQVIINFCWGLLWHMCWCRLFINFTPFLLLIFNIKARCNAAVLLLLYESCNIVKLHYYCSILIQIFSHPYAYCRPYYYCFGQIIPPVPLFQTIHLFRTLEYLKTWF